jgi:hypothetical protein
MDPSIALRKLVIQLKGKSKQHRQQTDQNSVFVRRGGFQATQGRDSILTNESEYIPQEFPQSQRFRGADS